MSDLKNIQNSCWQEHIGATEDTVCTVDVVDSDIVRLSYFGHTQLFQTENFYKIPEFVNSLTEHAKCIVVIGKVYALTNLPEFIENLTKSLILGGKIWCQWSPTSRGQETNDILELINDFIKFMGSQCIQAKTITPTMNFTDIELTSNICNSSDIEPHAWQRILSWIGVNTDLTELFLLLQRNFFATLRPDCVNTFVMEFEHLGEISTPNVMYEDKHIYNINNKDNLNATTLFELDKSEYTIAFLDSLNRLLQHIPCAVFWFRLSQYFKHCKKVEINTLLSEKNLAVMSLWEHETLNDHKCENIIRSWHKLPGLEETLTAHGVQLGKCMEYDLMRDVLTHTLRAFKVN
jgi:hypothetical protein